MTKFKIKVSDTITYERYHVVEIEAADEEKARDTAIDRALAGEFHEVWEESEFDNTPYEAEILENDDE